MIELRSLTKRYGTTTAVDDLSCTVQPGRVTGFLGPNGAGKSTTMRMILGLDRPTSGTALIRGLPYEQLKAPMREVGALLDARAVHQGRTARQHLRCLADSNGLAKRRVDEVLEMVGMTSAADQRAGKLSLGMSQRLGIAAALLGDPGVLLLDEPVNGLDTDGIRWIRQLMQRLAREGRTVLVSSHLMSEMALTAGHVIVIGRGRLIADTGIDEFVRLHAQRRVLVRTDQADRLAGLLTGCGAAVYPSTEGALIVSDLDSAAIFSLAATHDVVLSELTPQRTSLEEAYVALTRESVEFHTEIEPDVEATR
jgi:ABC-2 type transport system ATP-binding protein